MEKKKNSKNFIIPASYFINKGITPVPVSIPEKKESIVRDTKTQTSNNTEKTVIAPKEIETPKITLNTGKKATSGLSLKSIKAKKEHQIKQMEVIIDEENLPKDDFTEDQLISYWNTFIKQLEVKGQFNLASILSIDTPKVTGTTIYLEFPNATNKVEVERQQYDLMMFLKKSLNNYDLHLSIEVNEEMEKQYAFTPMEKYLKLKEKNPNIEVLKKTFGLDL
ncbi:DNA polymerase-3 subunit gamma/tau [Xanthomarina spongicola]|uniref:DNA polymerase-3 subunit gamma/tau n=1 Tax=Xanthomarina spongicola TaxID=570520 RepID=A0A316DIT6_9FLAO|nr:DNA polymerase-3 subunit gamma/tau [Xanthomarina spongicola]